jgi:RNA polymerase sigma factor FliA
MDMSVGDIAGLWREYKADGGPEVRERLILHYSPMVKFVAGRVGARLPNSIEMCDLVSYGIFGLIDAIDKFDPTRDIKFETYVVKRIRGAILDELRRIDFAPRSVRAKHRAIEQASSKLEHELRRSPEAGEIAAELGVTDDRLAKTRGQISRVGVVALDEPLLAPAEFGTGATLGDTIADGHDDPAAEFETKEMRQLMADAISRVSDRARLVLTLYYYEGLNLAAIGKVLGVTESRVCQIHRQAILELRGFLSEPVPERRFVA